MHNYTTCSKAAGDIPPAVFLFSGLEGVPRNAAGGGGRMELRELVNYLWVVVAAALVFFMQAGFSMVESGLTRSKNSINVAIKNLTDLGVSMIVFWLFGFALMFGNSRFGFTGSTGFLPDFSGSGAFGAAAFFLFQAMFASTSATIVSGAVAERMKYGGYILGTLFLSGLVYPLFGHWAWGGLGGESTGTGQGWLASIGFVDFAGSTVVHSVGGYVSLAALLVLGSRTGRFRKNGAPVKIPGSNVPLSVAGVIILWFGWIGFNGGSTLAMTDRVPSIILHTCLAGGAGMLSALFLGWAVTGIPDVTFVMNGSLAGLVAITANCHAVTSPEAVIIGAVAGLVMLAADRMLELFRIDDAVGAIPVHLAAGVWGTLAVGLFGDPDLLAVTPIWGSQIAAQVIGIGACALWSFGVSYAFFRLLNLVFPLRVSPDDEKYGLNAAEHGASTELFELFSTMEEQAAGGDLSLRLPVEPFTEIGQIAERYNAVMAALERNTIAREEYQEIFRNVSDGLFLLDSSFRVLPAYSAATERIFGSRELAGKDVRAVFRDMLSPEKAARFDEFIALMFNPEHSERAVRAMNPLLSTWFRVHRGYDAWDDKVLDVSFHRIYNDESAGVSRVMAVTRDVTQVASLSREVKTLKSRLGGLGRAGSVASDRSGLPSEVPSAAG